MKKVSQWLSMGACVLALSAQSQDVFYGRVIDDKGAPLPAAIVQIMDFPNPGDRTEPSTQLILLNSQGQFQFDWPFQSDSLQIIIKLLGYNTVLQYIQRPANAALVDFTLTPKTFEREGVVITASRMNSLSPGTYTNLDRAELQKLNLGQDLPYQLRFTPSLIATSDAGAGVGYTGLRIRGSDQTRINVTINGIPINDSESQGVFWVNMPDLTSSLSSAQIQRGLGSSTNGSAAFGASVNLLTTEGLAQSGGSVAASFGSFNTRKLTAQVQTGQLAKGFSAEARLSDIQSDGYVDRASSDLNSYYLAGGFQGSKASVKAIAFGGHERTYQSWYGVPESRINNDLPGMLAYAERNFLSPAEVDNLLQSDRRYNFYTYQNQVDNYDQNHLQLHVAHQFNDRLSLKLAAHYTHGEGYFEQYRVQDAYANYGIIPAPDEPETTDLIRRRWLNNDFYGGTYQLRYALNNSVFTLGGGLHQYDGDHYGEIVWAEFSQEIDHLQRYYQGTGDKGEQSIFAKWEGTLGDWVLMADLQYRGVQYQIGGIDNTLLPLDVHEQYQFFNPKVGARYRISDKQSLYAYAGMGHREPVRSDFIDALTTNIPKPERMIDLELGHTFRTDKFQWNVNGFFMYYRDQLVLTGALNDVGASIRVNVPESFRAGIEIDGGYVLSPKWSINAQVALSANQIGRFDQITYAYSDAGVDIIEEQFDDTPISFSPAAIASARLLYQPIKSLEIEWLSKFVSRQYLDNTGDVARSLDAYWVNDLRLAYRFDRAKLKGLSVQVLVNNVFGEQYSSNGYTYSYMLENLVTENFYYPQAERNFLVGVRYDF